MSSPKILVVDDDPAIRDGLRRLLTRAGHEVHVAPDGLSALELGRQCPVDVVVTDIQMPGLSGLDLIGLFKKIDPAIQVIVLTGYATLEAAVTALREAACDFLQKPMTDPRQLELAIANALVRRHALLAPQPPAAPMPVASERLQALNKREHEILTLAAQGLDNAEIAERIALSPTTVRNYMSTIYGKLGVENRIQATMLLTQPGRSPAC